MNDGRRRRVVVIQEYVGGYTADLLIALEQALGRRGIALEVVAGEPRQGLSLHDARDRLARITKVRNRRLGRKMYWQDVRTAIAGCDLVIMEQANAILSNHVLALRRRLRGVPPRLAYWGHGATFHDAGGGAAARAVKRRMIPLVDHWFAYTEITRRLVCQAGMPDDRITVLNNSIDTGAVVAARESSDEVGRTTLRARLGLSDGPVVVFCSRLLPEKNLPFLVAACEEARAALPALQLAVIGDGPQADWLADIAGRMAWVRPFGARYGAEKAEILAAADIMAMPALVGLSILDGFAAGLPLVTTDFAGHGPEISYLEDGHNGIMTSATQDRFAVALVRLLHDVPRRKEMSRAAVRTAEEYSFPAMVVRFVDGIERALGPP